MIPAASQWRGVIVTTSEELPCINNTVFQIMGPVLTVPFWNILSKQRMLARDEVQNVSGYQCENSGLKFEGTFWLKVGGKNPKCGYFDVNTSEGRLFVSPIFQTPACHPAPRRSHPQLFLASQSILRQSTLPTNPQHLGLVRVGLVDSGATRGWAAGASHQLAASKSAWL